VQLDELMNPEAGYLVKEGVVLCVEVLECCPWFEFADLEKYASDEEAASTVSCEDEDEESASMSEASECSSGFAENAESFWTMMGRSGLGIGCAEGPMPMAPNTTPFATPNRAYLTWLRERSLPFMDSQGTLEVSVWCSLMH
jgi:hypothetical protein